MEKAERRLFATWNAGFYSYGHALDKQGRFSYFRLD
jgi:hypothetical protein